VRSKEIEKIKERLKLSDLQKEILPGILLGDAHLETQNSGKTFRLKFEQSSGHKDYLFHLYDEFEDWVRTAPKEKLKRSSGRESSNWYFQTLSHASLRFYGHQFYPAGKKVVPKSIEKMLSPTGLAYWYMDDGSIKSKESKGVIFNTQSFSEQDVVRLASILERKFGLKAKLRKQKDGPQIYVSGQSFETFLELVEPHIISSMKYKLPRARLTTMPKE